MRIHLLRHGESQANAGGYINDDPTRPVALTDLGREQAGVAARELVGESFDLVFCSRFPRARQTAEILLEGLGMALPIRVDARLDERRSGLDGQPVEAFNGLVRPDPVHVRPPDGESFLQAMDRMKAFLDEVATHFPGARVLAVSHENPIQAALAWTMDREQAVRLPLANCAWRVLAWPG